MNIHKKFLGSPLYIWAAFFLSSALFVTFSQIDIFVSSLFYDDERFTLDGSWVEGFFYFSLKPLLLGLASLTLLIYLYNLIMKRELLQIGHKTILYLLLVLALAPGLIVNATLKENWGRARPNQIQEFGGNLNFTPAFIPSDQGGYSFSSGHVAAAFSLMGFALLAKRRRELWMRLAYGYGFGMAVARIAAGGHFLSDTVTSFFIVYIATHLFYDKIIRE